MKPHTRANLWIAPFAVSLTLSIAACGEPAANNPAANSPTGSEGSVPNLAVPVAGQMSTAQFCTASQQIVRSYSVSIARGPASGMLRQSAEMWAKIAAIAPPEVKPDLQQMADVYQQNADGTIDKSTSDTELAQSLHHYATWERKNCPPQTSPRPAG
jgi:hypothetical protein